MPAVAKVQKDSSGVAKKLASLTVTSAPEPILTPNNRRFVLFPIKYQEVYLLYVGHIR